MNEDLVSHTLKVHSTIMYRCIHSHTPVHHQVAIDVLLKIIKIKKTLSFKEYIPYHLHTSCTDLPSGIHPLNQLKVQKISRLNSLQTRIPIMGQNY